MNDTLAFNEIHDLHVLIEDWFTGRSPVAALDTLLARFSEDFSMVGIAGRRLDRHAVRALFAAAHGARPGLVIIVEDIQAIPIPGPLAVLRYRESQRSGHGVASWRESLAVLRQEEGRWRWLALQETPSP